MKKKQSETFEVIRNTESCRNKDVQDELDISQSSASSRINTLEEKDWIVKKKDGRANILLPTEDGLEEYIEFLQNPHPTSSSTQSIPDSNNRWTIRAHNCSARAEISDKIPLLPKWFETWTKETDREWKKTSDGYITYVEELKVRFTKNYVIVYLPEVLGEDTVDVKNRVYEKAQRKLEMLEEKTPIKVKEKTATPRFSLRRQELALMNDPFAETCVHSNEVDLREQNYKDEDGDLRFHIDCSNGVPELEFVNPSLGEEDADFYREDVIGELIENKGKWNDFTEKLEGDHLDRTEHLIRMMAELMTMQTARGMGQRQQKHSETNNGRAESNTEGHESNTSNSINSSKTDSMHRREEVDMEKREKLSKLEGRMKMRMEKWENE